MFMRLLILGIVFVTSGCALMTPPNNYQQELVSMQTRIMQIEEELKSKGGTLSQKNLAKLQTTVNRLERQLRMVGGQVDAVKSGHADAQVPATVNAGDSALIAQLEARITELESQQKEFVMELAKANSGASSSKSTKNAAKTSSINTFDELRDLFNKKQYKAVLANADTVKANLKNSQKMEFDYILAESHFGLGDMKNAALKFNEYIDRGPKGQAFAHAKLRMGDCFRELGDKDTAKIYYNEVIAFDEKMDEASQAKKRLKQL